MMNQLPSLPDKDTKLFFIVSEKFPSQLGRPSRERLIKSVLSLSDFVTPRTLPNPISTFVRIPDSSPDGKFLTRAVLRRALAMPAWSDRLFVCVLKSHSNWLAPGRFELQFTVMYGARGAAEEEEVGWDLVEAGNVGLVREVLWACKPPVPCLRKVAVEEEDGISCEICSVDVVGGRHGAAASAAGCGHVFHPRCIVNWLAKNPACPSCSCPLHLGL